MGREREDDVAVGDLLRARRGSAPAPDTLGRRRVSGLRREEVAARAGVSVSYYTRIEQGVVSPTPDVLDAVARALELSPEDLEYLHDLRSSGRPRGVVAAASHTLDDGLRRTLMTLHAVPAAVLAFDMTVLAWNPRAHEIFAPHVAFDAPGSASPPNWAVLLFADPYCRALFTPWEPVALDMVGRLRASRAKHPGEPRLEGVIRRLRTESPEFTALWNRHPVRLSPLGVVRLQHPSLGRLILRDTVLRANSASDQFLFLFHDVPQV